jgi:GTPase SAR1 family protein
MVQSKKLRIEKTKEELIRKIKENKPIERKHAHSIFVGPTGSGKSSLMARLLHRKMKSFSSSTGVSDAVVTVDVNIDNPSTFHAVAVTDPNSWDEVDYDASLVRQLNEESVPAVQAQAQQEETVVPSFEASSRGLLARFLHGVRGITKASARSSSTPKLTTPKLSESDITKIADSFVVKYRSLLKLTRSYSLYMRDTGGQVEFQEMIALVIFGPSIFFFVFRIDLEFQSKFHVEYRVSEGESTNRYTSSITTEEALFQCLASVYAMDTSGNTGVKTHKPLVFIVGSHVDKLEPPVDEKIAKLNEHLHSLIEDNGFQDIVEYANRREGRVMYTVNNTSTTDDDIKPIRSRIHTLVTSHNEFNIEYPIGYLLFCLDLQKLKCNVLTIDECRAMAARCGIVGKQVLHLLHFLHLRIGVIQYFDVDGLRHIVVKEPQVLFNKVTSLIIKTFSSDILTTREWQNFQKGILTASMLESVIGTSDGITPQEFLKLLVHLRIIAPYSSTTSGDSEKRYFIPCVLNHVQESSEEDLRTGVLPLSIQFQCLHCPKGLFGVLVTHLMAPSTDDSHIFFTLLEDKIFKDQVSFEVHSQTDQAVMSLKLFPSHLEVNFFPSLCEDGEISISNVCSNVRQTIEASILRSLEDLHYDKCRVQPVACFRCEHCCKLHPVKHGYIYCRKKNQNRRIPENGRCWYSEGEYH